MGIGKVISLYEKQSEKLRLPAFDGISYFLSNTTPKISRISFSLI